MSEEFLTEKQIKAALADSALPQSRTLLPVLVGIGDRIYKHEGARYQLLDNEPPRLKGGAIDGP